MNEEKYVVHVLLLHKIYIFGLLLLVSLTKCNHMWVYSIILCSIIYYSTISLTKCHICGCMSCECMSCGCMSFSGYYFM